MRKPVVSLKNSKVNSKVKKTLRTESVKCLLAKLVNILSEIKTVGKCVRQNVSLLLENT